MQHKEAVAKPLPVDVQVIAGHLCAGTLESPPCLPLTGGQGGGLLGAAPAPKVTQPAASEKDSEKATVNGGAQGAKDAEGRHEPDRSERFALPHHGRCRDEQRRGERQAAECELDDRRL